MTEGEILRQYLILEDINGAELGRRISRTTAGIHAIFRSKTIHQKVKDDLSDELASWDHIVDRVIGVLNAAVYQGEREIKRFSLPLFPENVRMYKHQEEWVITKSKPITKDFIRESRRYLFVTKEDHGFIMDPKAKMYEVLGKFIFD